MSKKIFLSVFLAAALLAVSAILARNYLLQRFLASYLKNTLHGSCSISSTNVSLGSIKINDFSFSNPDYKITLKHALVAFSFSPSPLINISSVRLEEGKVEIKNLDNLKKQFATPPGPQGAKVPAGLSGVSLYLKDIGLELENVNNIRVKLSISLALRAKEGGDISISDMTVTDFNAESEGFAVSALAARGEAFVRIQGGELSDIRGTLTDNSGGLINIKDESSLGFLRKYMDELSFKALVENFKNYAYNIGEAAVRRENRDIIAETDFDSPTMGHRYIVIDFHDQLTGE